MTIINQFFNNLNILLMKKILLFLLVFASSKEIFAQFGSCLPYFSLTSSDGLCRTWYVPINSNTVSDVMYFGDGTSQSVNGNTSITHCYPGPGLYEQKRYVTLQSPSGSYTSCSYSQPAIRIYPVCPQLQGMTAQLSTQPLPHNQQCIPIALKSSGQNNEQENRLISSPLIDKCDIVFTPVLNMDIYSVPASYFNWNMEYFDIANGIWVQGCSFQGTRKLGRTSSSLAQASRITLTVSGPDCPTQTITRLFIYYPMGGSALAGCESFIFFLKSNEGQNDEYFLKKPKSNLLTIYPNPTTDNIMVGISDSEIYSFEIYNTLGQNLINQRVTIDAASVDLSNLNKGVYIGVLKSKDKIVHTEKIYKN
jgi:Secretion system C-terminal sorting domain